MPISKRRSYYRPDIQSLNIPAKANRVLNLVLIAIILIILRIWHLAVIQYEEKLEESRKPQRRVIIEPAKRATIRDRFNIPLAINKVQYRAAVLYSQLRQIPSVAWETNSDGKRIKHFKRKEYIAGLAKVLGNELSLDPDRVEDLIHSKASFYYQIPYIIKEDISEKEYYRLKMLEKDWLGIHVQKQPRRDYPYGKTAADIIGYMGAINRQEYESIIGEMKALQNYLEERESMGDAPLPEGLESPAEVRRRLKDIQEKAYTINDYVGKTGIEGRFEQELRGFHGKKSYYSDARGNFLRELPSSREPLSGQRFLLTISVELQEYAEKLLTQNERIREGRVSGVDFAKQALLSLKQPWIKGGAIVAMEPHTGEVLALASYPRYDPNDFITTGNPAISKIKRSNILRWFESEDYLGEIWDQKRPLERERYDDDKLKFYEEAVWLTWDNYLNFILPKESTVRDALQRIKTLENAVKLQQNIDALLTLSGEKNAYALFNALYNAEGHIPYGLRQTAGLKDTVENNLKLNAKESGPLKKKADRFLSETFNNYDKVLAVDLCRMLACGDAFSDELLKSVGSQTLSYYRDACAAMIPLNEVVHDMARELFKEIDFKAWRKDHEKEFLKGKRAEEKASQRYAKPYLEYIDAEEQSLFQSFWREHRWTLLGLFLKGEADPNTLLDPGLQQYLNHFQAWHQELSQGAHQAMPWRKHYDLLRNAIKSLDLEMAISYLMTLRGFDDLTRPLLGRYPHVRKKNNQQLEKHLAAAFYPANGFGYGRSQAYRQAATQGSIFKLVTAYEALVQRYNQLDGEANPAKLNPLTLVDQVYKRGKDWYVGYDAEGKPIPQIYKGGRLVKSSAHSIGKLDILRAIENSSNPYFSLLAGEVLSSPGDLSKAARLFAYGCCTGIDLPGEISGKIPVDLETNKTGLYATAIGQHSLVVTPLQTAVMLSALANGGKVMKPKIVSMTAGRLPMRTEDNESCLPCFPYQENLMMAGVNFPLFAAVNASGRKNLIKKTPSEVIREIFMPEAVRYILLEGMRRVVVKTQNESLGSLSRFYRDYPEAISDYIELKEHLIGKTSTAEVMENLDLDIEYGTNKYTHVWFGGISFNDESEESETFIFRDPMGIPELVVVVYLRFGGFGKEAAPVAAQMVAKWREIKKKR